MKTEYAQRNIRNRQIARDEWLCGLGMALIVLAMVLPFLKELIERVEVWW